MILAGNKKEEYREIKPYWDRRLLKIDYDAICFRNGYAKDAPRFIIECLFLSKRLGNPELGAPKHKEVYVLELGKLI